MTGGLSNRVRAAAPALAGLAAILAMLGEGALRGHDRGPAVVAGLLAAATGAAVLWWPRRPRAALVAIVVLVLAGLPVLGDPHAAVTVAVLSAALTAHRCGRLAAVTIGVAMVPCLAVGVAEAAHADERASTFSLYLVVLLAAVAAADATRARRDAAAARASQHAAAAAAAARQLFDEHRLELAREIHDNVAHALVAIHTQAGVALHVHAGAADPAVVGVLGAIKAASASALQDLRVTLGDLRSGSSAAGTRAEDLEQLARPLEALGTSVTVHNPRPSWDSLSAELAATVYRIVQEALTNVLKHSNARSVRVDVSVGEDGVAVSVTDDGTGGLDGDRGDVPHIAGYGLRGLVERTAAWGGTLRAGPAAGGGWSVVAHLTHQLRPTSPAGTVR